MIATSSLKRYLGDFSVVKARPVPEELANYFSINYSGKRRILKFRHDIIK